MSATGTEVVTLSQLKMLGDTLGGAGGKKYKIKSSLPTQVQSSASAGDVVITAAGRDVVDYTVQELVEEGQSLAKIISEPHMSSTEASIDDLPQVV